MSSREPLDCSVDPVPPSERTNLGGIRLQLRDRRLNRGDLVGQRRIYLPFDRPPELLQDTLGRVQLRTVRREPNQRQTPSPDPPAPPAAPSACWNPPFSRRPGPPGPPWHAPAAAPSADSAAASAGCRCRSPGRSPHTAPQSSHESPRPSGIAPPRLLPRLAPAPPRRGTAPAQCRPSGAYGSKRRRPSDTRRPTAAPSDSARQPPLPPDPASTRCVGARGHAAGCGSRDHARPDKLPSTPPACPPAATRSEMVVRESLPPPSVIPTILRYHQDGLVLDKLYLDQTA